MPQRRPKRPGCTHDNCGSRRFHTGDDGFRYCAQGHQQPEQITASIQDTGELVLVGQKSRRKESDAESIATSRSKSITRPQALESYLIALQLVLRKQLKWLIEVQQLPAELEAIAKDLWGLRLHKLKTGVSLEYDTDGEGQPQLFTSQSEGEGGTETQGSQSIAGSQRARTKHDKTTVNLTDIMAICYLGGLLLRIPMTVADLSTWVDEGRLLYYQALKQVPVDLREQLPEEYLLLLEPQHLLNPLKVHEKILEVSIFLNGEFGMTIPAPNHALLLYRWIKTLALPLETFAASQRLARLLNIDSEIKTIGGWRSSVVLRYPEAQLMALLVVATKLFFPLDNIDRHPESHADLSALSMDWGDWAGRVSHVGSDKAYDRKRQGLSYRDALGVTEAECLTMGDQELDEYLDWYAENMTSENVLREHGSAGMEVEGEELDAAAAQSELESEQELRRTLLRLFPARAVGSDNKRSTTMRRGGLSDGEGEGYSAVASMANGNAEERLRRVQNNLRTKRVIGTMSSGDDGLVGRLEGMKRVGCLYRRYRHVDELEEGPVRVLYGKAAELAGLTVDAMVRAVFLTERQLQVMRRK